MDDLISRQDAIDALDEQIEQCDKALSSFDISMRDEFAVKAERASLVAFRETLEYLPSAQPATNCSEIPNNSDTISRQAAIDALYSVDEYNSRSVKAIKQLPPIQPKRGRWIPVTNGRGGHECGQCHEYAPSYQSGEEHLSDFCPNCGAKMEVTE